MSSRTIGALALTVMVAAGCSNPSQASQASVGNVRGFVGIAGPAGPAGQIPTPIANVVVSIGALTTMTANPSSEQAIAADAEIDDRQPRLIVTHDFGDGSLVPTERRLLAKPPQTAPLTPGLIINGPPSDVFNKYVYLRRGEYFLEGVPAGRVTVTFVHRSPAGDGKAAQEVTKGLDLEVVSGATTDGDWALLPPSN